MSSLQFPFDARGTGQQSVTVATFDDARALAPGLAGTVNIGGKVAIGDGLGGPFVWDANSVAADDNNDVLAATSQPGIGRLVRASTISSANLNGVIVGLPPTAGRRKYLQSTGTSGQWVALDVYGYGAVGDGNADDTAAFQAAAAAACANVSDLVIPDGTFRITDQINITAPIRVTGRGRVIFDFGTSPANTKLFNCFVGGVRFDGFWIGGRGDVRVQITDVSGGTNVGQAKFRWSSDGGATWTTGVTTAASVALDATGLTVHFPSGSYATDQEYAAAILGGTGGSFVLGISPVLALGAAPLAVTITGTPASAPTTTTVNRYAIYAAGSAGAPLAGLKVTDVLFTMLNCGNPAPPGVLASHAIYATYVDDLLVERCTIATVHGAAVFVANSLRPRILSNTISDTAWYSIELQKSVTGARVIGNSITGTTPGIRYWGGSINLMSDGFSSPHQAQPVNRAIIRDNYISGYHGYYVCIDCESVANAVIEGNLFDQAISTLGGPLTCVRVGSRAYTPPSTNFGPSSQIRISGNVLIAGGPAVNGVYADVQDGTVGSIGRHRGLVVDGNQIHSPDDNTGPMSVVRSSGTTPPTVTLTGSPTTDVTGDVLIQITTLGARGTAVFRWSIDTGATWTTGVATAATAVLGTSGLTANFAVGTYAVDNLYSAYRTANAITKTTATGTTPPLVTIDGTPTTDVTAAILIKVTTGGARGTALFKWSIDGGTTYTTGVTTAASVSLGTSGLTAYFNTGTYATDHAYTAYAKYFAACVILHGQQGGISNVQITHNDCAGVPNGVPVDGIIGVIALNDAMNISDVLIFGNHTRFLGVATNSAQIGIWIGQYTNRITVDSNVVQDCYFGIRSDAFVSGFQLGNGNQISGSISANYVLSSAPDGNVVTLPGSPVAQTGDVRAAKGRIIAAIRNQAGSADVPVYQLSNTGDALIFGDTVETLAMQFLSAGPESFVGTAHLFRFTDFTSCVIGVPDGSGNYTWQGQAKQTFTAGGAHTVFTIDYGGGAPKFGAFATTAAAQSTVSGVLSGSPTLAQLTGVVQLVVAAIGDKAGGVGWFHDTTT